MLISNKRAYYRLKKALISISFVTLIFNKNLYA